MMTYHPLDSRRPALRRQRRTAAVRATLPLAVGAAAMLLTVPPATVRAQDAGKSAEPQLAARDPRWAAVRRVFGQDGEADGSTFRVSFPRTDVTVRVGDHTLATGFELTSYVGFAPAGVGRVLAMSEIICRADEVAAVLEEARHQGVDVPALHNHLLGESPRIMYVHAMAMGDPATVAQKIRAIYARTATPMQHQEEAKGNPADYAAITAVLGKPEEIERGVAEYVFPRRERLTEHGVTVPSNGAIETASEVVFQRLASGQMATGGELYVAPNEITPVVRVLGAGGIHVTAIHNHMVQETPRLYWIHWYGTGEPAALARTVKTALEQTQNARQSKGK